jgi:hypothetical protein
MLAVVLIFRPTQANAASFNVATGSGNINDGDSICQLQEAWENINDGARTYLDCVETGVYGTNDTINLPVGTIVANGLYYTHLSKSAKIVGQGRGVSIIDDTTMNLGGDNTADITLQDFTLMSGSGLVYAWGLNSLTVDRVELDGKDDAGFLLETGELNYLTVRDSYLHNGGDYASGIRSGSGLGNDTVVIERTTISRVGMGIYLFNGDKTKTATIKNTTITDISGGDTVAGILVDAYDGAINYTTINNTYSNMTRTGSGFFPAAAIMEASEDSGHITHITQNDLYAVGDGADSVNYIRIGDGSGMDIVTDPNDPHFTLTSLGGNLSSDGALSAWLNQSSDKHNVTSLASFLGALSDNGGPVPTLALLQGSPAINAGTPVSGLTTDARGAARVQGGAIDAGAYESAFTTAAAITQDPATLASTGQNAGLTAVIAGLLTLGGGVVAFTRRLKDRGATFISNR